MRKIAQLIILVFTTMYLLSCSAKTTEILNLKDAYAGLFKIGTALDSAQIEGADTAAIRVVTTHFNSIVAENCMKPEVIQATEGNFDFRLADKFVAFGERNKMKIIGHTLVWHSQTPDWFFKNADGQNVSREILIERMRNHITTLVSRYKGRVKGWDVVNEALNEDGTLRKSLWFEIIGPDFIKFAFQFAHAADPKAELYYNDYNLYKPEKRMGVVTLIKSLKASGCRIDAIGEQAHYGLGQDILAEIDKSILAFSDEKVKVMITELDISVLPFPAEEITADVSLKYQNSAIYNPYPISLPDSIQQKVNNYYQSLFSIYRKHHHVIDRVTFWGVNDAQSWRNYWPIHDRTDYPLLFDRNNKPKSVVQKLIELKKI
ncbi:MAG: endo-1,4-beta-xylanase [Paludibacter sp.]|nr:endo-1,4-beta-xylanase [Paludibacter sp.]